MTTFIVKRKPYPPGLPKYTKEDGFPFILEGKFRLETQNRGANNEFFADASKSVVVFSSRTPFTRKRIW